MKVFRLFRKEYARVVYSSDYIYGLPSVGDHQTFDIMRFKKIRDKLVEEGLLHRKNILRPYLCKYEELRLVHTESYLRKLQNPQYVSEVLKLDAVNMFYDSILEYYRAVTGGTLLATAFGLKNNIPTFNLGGGYHHAHPDKAEGFCLVNDVAIAIEKFRQLKRAQRYMVIDLDYHQGNGTLLYFKNDPDVFTFSMHGDAWVEIERPHNLDILLPHACDDNTYLTILEEELPPVFESFNPEVVFYIAGSDVYEKDAIGDMKLTREGILKRNLFVYRLVRSKKIPLIVLAGGGYGLESWKVYYDFIAYCLKNKI
ncbi:MAG TPA: histone deacetylase [Caldithrix abyssi]|uniref:Histone deacetylase n=1 Tax=Caldithrix abyssi TaxID=187145 RepID=A0A7V5H4T2_CALAY|nr:histone deacetylase [Caldithrix abyssi]